MKINYRPEAINSRKTRWERRISYIRTSKFFIVALCLTSFYFMFVVLKWQVTEGYSISLQQSGKLLSIRKSNLFENLTPATNEYKNTCIGKIIIPVDTLALEEKKIADVGKVKVLVEEAPIVLLSANYSIENDLMIINSDNNKTCQVTPHPKAIVITTLKSDALSLITSLLRRK